jgi:prolycopene isomerase
MQKFHFLSVFFVVFFFIRRMTMTDTFDYIVIGAGPGGATVASLLAKDGRRVLVLDKNSHAGGKMLTMHNGGHYYEMFPLNLIPYAPSLFEELERLTGKKVRNVAREYKDQVNILYHGRDDVIYPIDIKDFDTFKRVGISAFAALKVIAKLYLVGRRGLKKLEKISALDYMNSIKMPEALRVFLTASFGEGAFEMTADKVPASHLIRILKIAMGKRPEDMRYYEGGISGFFDTIIAAVPEHGGELAYHTRVKSIDIEDGAVKGVTTGDGRRYFAPVVISNAGIRQTVFGLAGERHFEAAYAERIRGLESNLADVGYRYFTSKPVLEHSTYVYLPYNCLERWSDFEAMKDGKRRPESNYIYIGTKSVYPTISPAGKQVIYAVMSAHPDPEQDISPHLEYIERKMRRLFPALFEEGVIEKREVMDLHSVYALGVDKIFEGQGGESYGIANSIGQSDGDRPSCSLPVRGLYCVGNDTEGFGVGTHRAVESGFKVYEKVVQQGRAD